MSLYAITGQKNELTISSYKIRKQNKASAYRFHINMAAFALSKQWSDIVRQHDLPAITFHGLRHSYASFMLDKGVNIKVIQEQLGHANIQETLNTYSHVTLEQKQTATSLFDSLQ